MKKKLMAVLLSTAMVFSMVACGGSDNSDAETTTDSTATTQETTEETTASSDVKIGLVTDVGGVNDGSFNQSAWEGLQRANEDLGIEVNYLESKTDSDYTPNIEQFMDEEYDLIICVGYMLADATRTAAEANPDQKFAIIDDASCSDLDNVSCLMFKQEQASYLVGYVAGLTTESNKVGFVLGMENETMNQFGYGFCAGVKDANADAEILQANANSFADSATGKSNANTMITNGADVIFHAAGATGLGVIEACQEAGIKAIGVDSDQSSIAPDTIITSAMKRVDNAVYDAAKSIVEGSYTAGVITYDLSMGGVDIAPTTDLLSEETIAAVNEVKEKILSGEITVPSNKDEFEAAYGDIYTLDK
ncbi:MAG: BMP family ABC transporter substrate-binding protein [Lachnospiraceae bacterium]|nr:BMP family ABC transporter substrate-binding protein [Lachnospiraceae bacterium]